MRNLTILRFNISVYYLCNFVTSFSVQNVCRNLHPASGGFWELAFAFFSSILDQESCCIILVEKIYLGHMQAHSLSSATPRAGKKVAATAFY